MLILNLAEKDGGVHAGNNAAAADVSFAAPILLHSTAARFTAVQPTVM